MFSIILILIILEYLTNLGIPNSYYNDSEWIGEE